MTDIILLSETQLQKILTTLESLKSGGVHWEQVIPVFLSAALGMCVGIGLELFKSDREKAKAVKERSKKEVQHINATIVAIAFNIETLLHSVLRFIIPHYKQSHAAYAAFRKTNGDSEMLRTFDLSVYPSFRTMCPEEHFIETDFLDKLPFVIEKKS